jgi:hypothetical protein
MKRTMLKSWLALFAACLFVLAGCSSSNNSSSAPTRLRVLHAVPDAETLDILVEDEERVDGLAFSATSSYFDLSSGNRAIKARSNVNGAVLTARNATLSTGISYSMFLHGNRSAIQTTLLVDDTGDPSANKIKLRVMGLNPDVGITDLYVTPTADISAVTPIYLSISYGTVIDYAEFDAGTRYLTFTTGGTKDIVFQSAPITFTSGQKLTLATIASLGAKLSNATLMGTEGGTFIGNGLARVKGVNGLAGSTLKFNFGTTASAGDIAFGTGSAYATVLAGSTTVSVESAGVPGVILASTTTTLAPARDYSVVATGTLAAPVLSVVADGNNVPIGAASRIRFVNASAGTGPVDVLLNFVSRATAVLPGTESAYLQVASGTTYTVTFVTPGGTTVIASVDGNLETGGVYTAYLFGPASSPSARLVRDR